MNSTIFHTLWTTVDIIQLLSDNAKFNAEMKLMVLIVNQ